MKTMKKMNVGELKSLSRTEMKNIMAGSGTNCGDACTADSDCNGPNSCKKCSVVLSYPGKWCVTSA